MDLFRVERYMGEDEDELHQQDESVKLTRLQHNIEDRKRKRQFDHDERRHVFPLNNTEASNSKQLMLDVQQKRNKKTKKTKTKELEVKSGKKREKRSSNKDKLTSTTDQCQNIQTSVDANVLGSESVETKVMRKEKKKNKEDKAEKKLKKQTLKVGLIAEGNEDTSVEISVDFDASRSPLEESKVTRKEEKKIKRSEDKSEKRMKKWSSKEGLTAKDGDEEYMEISPDSEINEDFEKRKKKTKKENNIPKEKGQSKQDPDEKREDKSEETGFTVIGGQKKVKEVKKVQRVLPDWLAKPAIINSDFRNALLPIEQVSYLDSHIIQKLQQHDINHLFPVQSVVIPAILSQMETNSCFGRGGFQPSDVCVSAPTGSGKTLAYVLPIIQSLVQRVVCHLRALVILPTKDLANQVKQVFEMFTEGTNLRVGLASGSKSFLKDQEQLVSHSSYGGSSRVDILICTPGRLVDHISSTSHFTLHHVRFLVIDEADRLLDQSYHGWLGKVLKAAYNKQSDTNSSISDDRGISCNLQTFRTPPGQQTVASFATIQLPLQKLLFSATMTHSPEKLAPLQLYQPILFTAMGSVNQTDQTGVSSADLATSVRYSIPEGLSEYMTVCSNGEKPLTVLYFLTQLKFQRVLCFTSSLEATHRLYLLVKLYGEVQVAEYSSSLTPQQRKAILRDFRLDKIQLLICSDAMARGMDIQDVSYVISYDVPNYVRSYIHRVGRTARAGNKGTAITLLHSEEVHHFKELIHKTGREKISKYNIKEDKLQSMVDKYQETLTQLQDAVKLESQKKKQTRGKQQVMKLLQEQLMNNVLQQNSKGNS